MSWTVNDLPSQAGRRILITGATSGIGFQAALELARRGAEIVLPARTLAKAADAIGRIRAAVPDARLIPAVLDLASLVSVRDFAKFYGESFAGPSLDVLVNNAGVMAMPKRELTLDGFERQFATNFLGPFALTALLFPHLRRQTGTRVVALASIAARSGAIAFENLQGERRYSPFGAYSQTKLADLMFARELQRRLSAAGSPVASIAVHPGIAVTNLTASMGSVARFLAPVFIPLIGQDAAAGALPILFAATSGDAKPGGYYGPNGAGERKGAPVAAQVPAAAKDEGVARRLWAEAERLTQVAYELNR